MEKRLNGQIEKLFLAIFCLFILLPANKNYSFLVGMEKASSRES
jgi:hypothetical protein